MIQAYKGLCNVQDNWVVTPLSVK